MSVFSTAPRAQPPFPPPSVTITTPKIAVTGGVGGVATAGLNRFATVGGSANLVDGLAGSRTFLQPPPWSQQQSSGPVSTLLVSSSLPSAAATAGPGAGGGAVGVDAMVKEAVPQQQQQPWVAVGGSWRDEENVCGYWRFSEGTAVVGGLEEGKQVHTLRRG